MKNIMHVSGARLVALAGLAGLAALASCSPAAKDEGSSTAVKVAPAKATIALPPMDAKETATYSGLTNVVTYGPGLFEGAQPEGAEGFKTLSAMGVRTVISVDGSTPDVAGAEAAGIRYIHLPIGYNGMNAQRAREIAEAVHMAQVEDPGAPVYIHCHHGKHRGAGAAGTAAVELGMLSQDDALAKMKISGTSPAYKGLFACVTAARPTSAAELDAMHTEFVSAHMPAGLKGGMVEIDETADLLKEVEKAGWVTPKEHPDLVPSAEAAKLADQLRSLKDNPQVKAKPTDFMDKLLASSHKTEKLEDMLVHGGSSKEELSAQLKVVAASCVECHTKYRD